MIIDLIKDKYKIVSVVGMSKNAGKTVALNEIIMESDRENVTLGLTSIGRDGESEDVVTWTHKPTIYVESGTIIATAEGLYELSQARLEIIEITEFGTSMGSIMIARAISSGNIQLAGPCNNVDIRDVSERMLKHGADLVIVDGALDRMSSASPSISDATILSTGAVLSRNMDKVIEQSVHQVKLFSIPVVEDAKLEKLARQMVSGRDIAIVNEVDSKWEFKTLEIRTALGAGKKISALITEKTKYIIVSGSLVEKTLVDIEQSSSYFRNIEFIVQDATRIFVSSRSWQILLRKGLKVKAIDDINLLAVTINPLAPEGYFFDSVQFKSRLQSFLDPLPVINVMEAGVC